MKTETRISTDLRVETRADRPGKRIAGYAALFGSETTIAGAFRERIEPGAFKRAIEASQDAVALINHNPDRMLGRVKSGTLELREDERGLSFSINPPDTQDARELVTLMERGDISGASFAFRVAPGGERWDYRSKPPVRTLTDLDLLDVSVVTQPAYPDASAALRSLEHNRVAAIREKMQASITARSK